MTLDNPRYVDADVLFKKLLRNLRPLFKQNGFRSSSQNFNLETEECWVVVNFQKSRWSNPSEKTFYINVAITPKRLLTFQSLSTTKAPAFYDCDWQWRAEQLGPDPEIQQWTIKDESTALEVLLYLDNLLAQSVIPRAKALATESALIASASSNPGYPQGKAVSVLLAAKNKVPELSAVVGYLVEHFGGGFVRDGMRDHIEKLRIHFPEQMHQLEL